MSTYGPQAVRVVARSVPVLETNFIGDWYQRRADSTLLGLIPSSVAAVTIGFVHDHGPSCSTLSALWRVIVPDILQSLLRSDDRLVCWLSGPLLHGGLVDVYKHVFSGADGYRSQLFPVSNTDVGPGYVTGGISAEYQRDWFDSLVSDHGVDLEHQVGLCGALAHEGSVRRLLNISRLSTPVVLDLLQECELLIRSTSHFEGIVILSQKTSAEDLMRRVGEGVPSYIVVERA